MAKTGDGTDISNKIEITGNVDTKKEGTYIITYTIKHSGEEVSIKRTVKVKPVQSQVPGNNTV